MSGYTVPIESAISNQTLTYFNLSYNVSGWKKSKEKKNFKSRMSTSFALEGHLSNQKQKSQMTFVRRHRTINVGEFLMTMYRTLTPLFHPNFV